MYKVGERLNVEDGTTGIAITEGLITIFIGFDNVSDLEVENFKNLPISFRLVHFKDVISILFRFERHPWNDLCYNPNMSPEIQVKDFEEGNGYNVLMIYHDTKTNIIKAMKFFTLSTWFSNNLNKMIREEQQKRDRFDEVRYLLNVDQMWYIYKSEDLAKRSSCYSNVREWYTPDVIIGLDDSVEEIANV